MRSFPTTLVRYERARLAALLLMVGLLLLVVLIPLMSGWGVEPITAYQAFHQEMPVAPLFFIAALLRPRIGSDRVWPVTGKTALIIGSMVALIIGWAGYYLVFQGYQLSRDEQMAVFDEAIFAHGRLVWPLATEWRPFADALNQQFMLPAGGNRFWVSAYLPVHAAYRALIHLIADEAVASPLLVVLSAACIWQIARRLLPDSNNSVILALALLLTSSQLLITSMTAFSMTMHLALNLLWLSLFLVRRLQAHVLAAGIGFLATGIHQPLFHPLFVLPFMFLLLMERNWRTLAFYGVAYGLIAAFWLAWPNWIMVHGLPGQTVLPCANVDCAAGVSYFQRLLATFKPVTLHSVWITAANLLRFICWQHPLLLPLALLGVFVSWRTDPIARALALGFALAVVVMAILLPFQGHGWGYRYLHPVLGNAVLLACYGFYRLEKNGLSLERPLLLTTVLAVLLVPVHAIMAARVAAPFAQVRTELESIPADVVIVDAYTAPYGQDVVLNRFDLSNRPKLLIAEQVAPTNLPNLCARSTIAFYDGPRMAGIAKLFGAPLPMIASAQLQKLREAAQKASCRVRR